MADGNESAYVRSGVDIDAAADAVGRMKRHVRSTMTPGVLNDVGSFGGMFALSPLGAMTDPVLVSSIDGVGTKLMIAFATGRHNTVGRDLVWHCANDILVQGARALFFLDYLGTGKLDPKVAEDLIEGMSDGCRTIGCALIGGETAEMPGLYGPGEYDLAGCIVGIVERSRVLDGSRAGVGDAVLGLASDGLHTNGYSLARHALLEAARLPLDRPLAELGGVTLADALLWPHRCYAGALLPLLNAGAAIHALAHITGGGFTDNIPRVLPPGVGARLIRGAWPVPPLFRLIQKHGDVSEVEMFRVFNMGIGMVVISEASEADALEEALTQAGERVYRLGHTVAGEGVSWD